jgi:hypothetical protein
MYAGVRSGQLWFALALILIGVVFLLRNYAGWQIDNWWALFLTVAAIFLLNLEWGKIWPDDVSRA